MGPRRLAMLRVTPEALADALGLLPGLRVVRVQEERDLTTSPADILIVIEDPVGDRVPLALEGNVLRAVPIESLR